MSQAGRSSLPLGFSALPRNAAAGCNRGRDAPLPLGKLGPSSLLQTYCTILHAMSFDLSIIDKADKEIGGPSRRSTKFAPRARNRPIAVGLLQVDWCPANWNVPVNCRSSIQSLAASVSRSTPCEGRLTQLSYGLPQGSLSCASTACRF